VESLFNWLRERGVVPTVAALRARADGVREVELARTFTRALELSPEQRTAVEAMSAALVKRLLHDPIARLKGADGERYVGAVRELFALDAEPATNGIEQRRE
jgi:glutamyl-tRNA reductase